jgi:hypothetical protein
MLAPRHRPSRGTIHCATRLRLEDVRDMLAAARAGEEPAAAGTAEAAAAAESPTAPGAPGEVAGEPGGGTDGPESFGMNAVSSLQA